GIPAHVSGMFPMSHIDFKTPNPQETKALFIQLMLEKGFLASNLYYAMNAHKMDHVSEYISAVDEAFKVLSDCLKNGKCSEMMKGQQSSTGFKRLT
ncbi:MAG: aminotransferase class III, partial [Dethiosulfovibrio sp.]|nr:aminotransferase class III [Dethiosulfovibrio sp.]